MACHAKEERHQHLLVFRYCCSNHMCGDKSVFLDLDESFRNTMTFGNNSTISAMSKGNIKIHTKENSNQFISKVFFVPD